MRRTKRTKRTKRTNESSLPAASPDGDASALGTHLEAGVMLEGARSPPPLCFEGRSFLPPRRKFPCGPFHAISPFPTPSMIWANPAPPLGSPRTPPFRALEGLLLRHFVRPQACRRCIQLHPPIARFHSASRPLATASFQNHFFARIYPRGYIDLVMNCLPPPLSCPPPPPCRVVPLPKPPF